jgi:hypothetical protein
MQYDPDCPSCSRRTHQDHLKRQLLATLAELDAGVEQALVDGMDSLEIAEAVRASLNVLLDRIGQVFPEPVTTGCDR